MNRLSKRGRGRPRGTGKTDDLRILREAAKRLCADGALTPTTVFRRLIGDDNPSAIRRLQVKWKRDKSVFLEEAGHMETEQFDPVRHANASNGALVRVNANNADDWNRISLAGWSQVRGLSNGEWIMRRDFPQGLVSLEDAPKYVEQCRKRMVAMLNDLYLGNPPYLAPPEW